MGVWDRILKRGVESIDHEMTELALNNGAKFTSNINEILKETLGWKKPKESSGSDKLLSCFLKRNLLKDLDYFTYQNTDSLLYWSLINKDSEVLDLLLSKKMNSKQSNSNLLIEACRLDCYECACVILKYDVDMSANNDRALFNLTQKHDKNSHRIARKMLERGYSAGRIPEDLIAYAIRQNDINDAKYILKKGVKINYADEVVQNSALIESARNGDLDLFKMILDAGANINVKNYNGFNALDLAVHGDKLDIVRYIHEFIQPIKKEVIEDYIYERLKDEGDYELIKYLNNINPDAYVTKGNNGYLMECAIKKGDLDTLKFILDQGISINHYLDDNASKQLNNKHITPLQFALSCGKEEIADYLLKRDCEIDIEKGTDLLLATRNNTPIPIVKKLLDRGIKANIKNSEGLINAVKINNFEMVKLLVDYGAKFMVRGMEAVVAAEENRWFCNDGHLITNYFLDKFFEKKRSQEKINCMISSIKSDKIPEFKKRLLLMGTHQDLSQETHKDDDIAL